LPKPVVERVATRLGVPTADVYGVTEFYEMFYTHPVGHRVLRICQDAPCALAGADTLMAGLCQHLEIEPGQTTPDGQYTVEPVRCLGLCDRAPAALVNLDRRAPLDPAKPESLLDGPSPDQRLAIGGLVKLALSNVGVVDPSHLRELLVLS
jgi:NADH:ubiquinone oxidoreductase subunit E